MAKLNVSAAFNTLKENIIVLRQVPGESWSKGQLAAPTYAPVGNGIFGAVISQISGGEVLNVLPEADRREKHLKFASDEILGS